jgi:hypothetical protein
MAGVHTGTTPDQAYFTPLPLRLAAYAAVDPIAIAAYPIVAAPFEHFTGFAGNRELPQQYRWFCGRQTVR